MGPFGNVAHQTANHVFSREVLAEMFAHPYRPMADSWLAALTSSYAELGQVSDYRKTLNMMVFLGDPLTPFRCFPRISGYAKKSGTLYSMPWATAVVCPLDGTGHADDVVGEIAIDARDFSTALPAQDLTISPPASSSMSFFPSLDVVADGASTLVTNDPGYPQGCYKATFTVKQSGGCGEALSTVKLQGEVVGHARVKIKSPDLDASGAVDLVDFSTFGNGFPVDPAVNDCRDFNNDNKVNMVDFSTFALHNGHETQGQIARGEQMLQSNAGIVLRFTEEFPTATQHRLYVDVDVESFSDVSVSLFALVAGDERLTFHEWLAGESVLGTVMFSPVERDGEKQLYFGALTSDQFAASEARLGRLVFDVSGSDPVEITDASFVMRTGEVLVEPEGGSPIVARMSGVLERVLDAEIVRIYHDRLEQNFPNPFNPTTTLAFSIKDASNVRLTIYDVAGRQVRELVDEQREPGAYKIVWDGHNDAGQRVSSGVYFFRLVSGSFTDTKKMTILK